MDDSLPTVTSLGKPEVFWERPPTSKRGTKNKFDLYTEVGAALTQWEMVESGFASLFGTLMQGHFLHSAERVYGSILSPSSRRDALNEAAAMFFHWKKVSVARKEEYRALMTHFGRGSGRRNDIAHGAVCSLNNLGYFLAPAPYNSGKNREFFSTVINRGPGQTVDLFDLRDYAYTADDIAHFRKRFKALRVIVFSFQDALQWDYLIPHELKGEATKSHPPEREQVGKRSRKSPPGNS